MNDHDEREQLIAALDRLSDWPADAGLPVTQTEQETANQAFYQFTTGSVQWLFPVGLTAEVATDLTIAPLPGADPVLAGLCQVQGQLVPVYQLHPLLGQPVPSRPVILLLQPEHQRLGLVVDAPPQRRDFNPEYQFVDEAPHPALSPLIKGVYDSAGEPLWVLSLNALGPTLQALGTTTRQSAAPEPRSLDTTSEIPS